MGESQNLIYVCPVSCHCGRMSRSSEFTSVDDTAKRSGWPTLGLYRDPLRSLTLLSLNVLSQKS